MHVRKSCFVMLLILSLVSTVYATGTDVEIKDIIVETKETQQIEIEIEIIDEPEVIDEPEMIIEPEIIEEVIKLEVVKFNPEGLLLNYGISSEEVERIKSFLRIKGYEVPEGYFYDGKTKEIVADYQSKNSLVADGIVGKNTYTKINEDMELNNIYIPKWQIDENLILPKELILINKSSNTLYHIKDNKIVERYAVATGKEEEYTPEGKFTIVNKYINPYWGGAGINKPIKGGAPNNPLGKRWMGLNIKGGGRYGIHGNANAKSIGKYVSLGCIRMHNWEVEYLFNIIPLGTEVWIGRQELINTFLINENIN